MSKTGITRSNHSQRHLAIEARFLQKNRLLTSPATPKRRYNWENTRPPTPMTQAELLQLIDQAAAEGWTELNYLGSLQ